MRRATPETIYSFNSAANPVTFTVRPGEVFQVETLPNAGLAFDSHAGRFTGKPWAFNASAGCIAVEGAKAGQNVIVHILGIALDEFGYTSVTDRSIVLPHLDRASGWEARQKIVPICKGRVAWSDAVSIPVAPMIGYLGVAQPAEVLSNAHNGPFGGNMDCQEVAVGARVHLPVLVDGARLHIGDVHAVQGDGEIDGAGGIETGAVLTLKVELADRPAQFRNPRIETDAFIATLGFARPADAAFAQALDDLVAWMVADHGFDVTGAHMLLAQVLSARATQYVNPLVTYICRLPREFLRTNRAVTP
jgi:acetamidase/formamidase